MFGELKPIRLGLLLVVGLFSSELLAAEGSLASRRPVPDFNVMLNDDGDWTFRDPDPEVNRRNILAAVDNLAGTAVKSYVRCVGVGSDILYYPTTVASSVGWREETGKYADFVNNARRGIDAGVDPIRLSGERCREMGIAFFPAVRINDAHFARAPLNDFRTSKFWMDNHEEVTLKSPPNRLDFRHQKVRDYRVDMISEVIDRYADVMDGIQLDFGRHACFFPLTTGMQYADLLTEVVVRVRRKLDEAAIRQGRPLYLIARVNPTLETCHYSAMDVEKWVKDGLVDVIIPAALYDLDYDMDITSFQSFTEPAGVKIYPTIYPRTPRMSHVQPFVRQPLPADYEEDGGWTPSIELIRGTIANMRHMGADGFETYNFRTPSGPLGFETLRACAHPAALTMQDCVFGIPPGKSSVSNYEPGKQIPIFIQSGKTNTFSLYVGQDFASSDDPAPAYTGLRIALRKVKKAPSLTISINGTVLHSGSTASGFTWITAPLHTIAAAVPGPDAYVQFQITDLSILKEGANAVQIVLDEGATVEISQIHLGVLYDNPYGKLN